MTAILDHLTAILVGVFLIGLLLFLQQRSQQVAVATTMAHTSTTQGFVLTDMLERDVENIQSEHVVGSLPQLWRENGFTSRFSFHTLAVPESGEGSAILGVIYRLEPTYDTVEVAGRMRPVYRVARFVNEGSGFARAGGSADRVVHFDVRFVSEAGATVNAGSAPDDLSAVTARIISVTDRPRRLSADQTNTFGPALSQQQIAIRTPAFEVTLSPDYEARPVPDVSAPLPAVPAPPPEPDACPDAPGWQAPGTDCDADACPEQPGHQPLGTICTRDACPLQPGWQAPGTECIPDACPEPGWQAPGTECTPDGCPEMEGWQAPGSDCLPPDACPNLPGYQPPGTPCTLPGL